MTRPDFNRQLARLGGLRFVPADTETHWEALRDLPLPVLEAAVSLAQRTRNDFPTPVELRQDADHARPKTHAVDPDRSEALPEPVALGVLPTGRALPPATRLWRYYCEVCNDTGVQSLWCGANRRQPWLEWRECGTFNCKSIKHGHQDYGHEWMKPCACADSNPAVLRKREQGAKYAPAPARGVA